MHGHDGQRGLRRQSQGWARRRARASRPRRRRRAPRSPDSRSQSCSTRLRGSEPLSTGATGLTSRPGLRTAAATARPRRAASVAYAGPEHERHVERSRPAEAPARPAGPARPGLLREQAGTGQRQQQQHLSGAPRAAGPPAPRMPAGPAGRPLSAGRPGRTRRREGGRRDGATRTRSREGRDETEVGQRDKERYGEGEMRGRRDAEVGERLDG